MNCLLEVSNKSLKGDVVVDASNKIITPGVIAPDTQIGILEIGAISETRDGDSDIYSMGFSVFDAINHQMLIYFCDNKILK